MWLICLMFLIIHYLLSMGLFGIAIFMLNWIGWEIEFSWIAGTCLYFIVWVLIGGFEPEPFENKNWKCQSSFVFFLFFSRRAPNKGVLFVGFGRRAHDPCAPNFHYTTTPVICQEFFCKNLKFLRFLKSIALIN